MKQYPGPQKSAIIAITSGSSSTSSSSSTMMSRSDFWVCANEASPGATVLKNALVKNGALFSFSGFRTGLLALAFFFFDEGADLVTRDAAVHLVTCGAADDLVTCGEADDLATCGTAEDLVTCGAAEHLVSCGAAEDLVTCGEAEDLVSSGVVEVDGSCLIGDSIRGGSFALLSSSSSNAVLQKSAIRE